MSTRFDGRRGSRHDDLPLAGLPGWGLEMMMGLYGPETIQRALTEETEQGITPVPWDRGRADESPSGPIDAPDIEMCGRDDVPPVFNQVDAELEAVNSLIRFLGRKLRRR
ncbi:MULTISPECIES: hypothetical protein [Gordonia]|nr:MULTISPECIES: hypothetical protein [Gordonia]MDH3007816.1 hypothetical protein [Gordonia alkanivorans]MDH3010654.1 hypothetical protein [Gordonia alkanivorans]MDH3015371.1 hypothetical protein [Gordonia alkanivorans]MDH3020115.1 hypothetical protein [Gordonia alkanivorans]MDH3040482.1 hypothetical protein [Gordonia alkanivorans]